MSFVMCKKPIFVNFFVPPYFALHLSLVNYLIINIFTTKNCFQTFIDNMYSTNFKFYNNNQIIENL